MKRQFLKRPFLFFLTMSLASLCWIFAIFQTVKDCFTTPEIIPAFQISTTSAE